MALLKFLSNDGRQTIFNSNAFGNKTNQNIKERKKQEEKKQEEERKNGRDDGDGDEHNATQQQNRSFSSLSRF